MEYSSKITHRKYKDYVESLKRTRNLNLEFRTIIKNAGRSVRKASESIVWRENGKIGDKLVKAGVALAVTVPEPVISNAMGATMMALGTALERGDKKHLHMKFRELLELLRESCKDIDSIRM